MNHLEKLTNKQFTPLLTEYAFLPTKNNPGETATSLNETFKNNKKYSVLGYIIDNKAVSYVIALSGRTDNEIAIGPMYVTESLRGKGLGKRQIMEFIQLYTQEGYESIYTKTWLGNAASRRSFESVGFIETGREDSDRVDGDSTISYAFHSFRR
jgi:RimJ/RimL family protein N-acetyltransferase